MIGDPYSGTGTLKKFGRYLPIDLIVFDQENPDSGGIMRGRGRIASRRDGSLPANIAKQLH